MKFPGITLFNLNITYREQNLLIESALIPLK